MKLIIIIIAILVVVSNLFSIDGDKILGKWYTENKKSIVEIYVENGKYQGKIIKLKTPFYSENHEKAGQIKKDDKNPDPEKRKQTLEGLKILFDFQYNEKKDKWIKGKIYDPESGNTYFCKISLNEKGELKIRGSLDKWGIAGKTTIWKRVN